MAAPPRLRVVIAAGVAVGIISDPTRARGMVRDIPIVTTAGQQDHHAGPGEAGAILLNQPAKARNRAEQRGDKTYVLEWS